MKEENYGIQAEAFLALRRAPECARCRAALRVANGDVNTRTCVESEPVVDAPVRVGYPRDP